MRVLGRDPGRLRPIRSSAQPLLDFYRGYQVRERRQRAARHRAARTTTSTTRAASSPGSTISRGERPYGNDLDPTLNLDILEVSFRNLARWQIIETPQRLETVHRIIGFQRRLVESGAFRNPRSHIYYLPELYSAYFGRCYAAFIALPLAAQRVDRPRQRVRADPRPACSAYVIGELIAHEMNPFDAALALMALAHLGAEVSTFTPALHCIVQGTSARAAGTGPTRPMSGTR